MKKEELEKELEKLKDFKLYVFEGDVYVKAEDYKEIAIENRKLKDSNTILKKGGQVVFTLEKRIDELLEENKKLKEEVEVWKNANKILRMHDAKMEYENKKLKEERIFSLEEYDYIILTSTTPQLKIIKKNQNYSLMEEDTLQELRDLGKI